MNATSTVALHTGNIMPVLAIGTWQLTNDTAGTVEKALAAGYSMIDTSGDYGTQPGIAEGIKHSRIDRSSIFVVTKVEEDEDAYESAKRNIDELQLDYADLILIHRPPQSGAGESLWEGLIRAKEDGITKDIGVSNYSAEKIQALIAATQEVPVVNQIEWSPFGHSLDMLRFANELDMIIQAYSPLTRGKRLSDSTLQEIANACGKSPAQVLIRWNLHLGTVPLPKANQEQHLRENIDIFDFALSEDEMAKLNSLNTLYSSLGSLPYV